MRIRFLSLHKLRKKKKKRSKTPALFGHPIKRGICLRLFAMNPKKPNSAERRVAQVTVGQNFHGNIHLTVRKKIVVHIPGIHHTLQQHAVIFIRGGRVRDLPAVHYRAIRGVKDLSGQAGRGQARSRYGAKDWAKIKKLVTEQDSLS